MWLSRDVVEDLLSDPWSMGYLCSIGKCDLRELSNGIVELISKPRDSLEYRFCLEFIKVFKSYAKPHVFLDFIHMVFNQRVIEKIRRDIRSVDIVELYIRDHSLAMDYLTILEIYPILGLSHELIDIVLSMIKRVDEVLKDNDRLRSFYTTLVYGPLSSLTLRDLGKVIREIIDLPHTLNHLFLKSSIVSMVVETYPPKMFQEHREFMDTLSLLIRDIVEKLIIMVDDEPELVIELYREINNSYYKIIGICHVLRDDTLCKPLHHHLDKYFNRLVELISKYIVF